MDMRGGHEHFCQVNCHVGLYCPNPPQMSINCQIVLSFALYNLELSLEDFGQIVLATRFDSSISTRQSEHAKR